MFGSSPGASSTLMVYVSPFPIPVPSRVRDGVIQLMAVELITVQTDI